MLGLRTGPRDLRLGGGVFARCATCVSTMTDDREQHLPRPKNCLLDAEDVAALLGVPKTWVYAETRAGRLPHVTVGRYRRYRLAALERWIADHERGPASPSSSSESMPRAIQGGRR